MKHKILIHTFFIALMLGQSMVYPSCSNAEEVKHPAPVFKSSIPEDQSTDVDISTTIEVVFDEVITLASAHGITVNDAAAEVEASLTKLQFFVDLSTATSYEITIPAGAVVNTFNVSSEEEIKIEFTTEAQKMKDSNFYIYLCFGQSNMEGQGAIESQDQEVNERFKVFQALDCANLGREKANWYTAVPPLCNCFSGLSPADYFGRTMVENLPDSITVGVINVAIGGCDIRLFDKDIYEQYDSTYTDEWFTSKVQAYGGNPYQHLMDLAKEVQKEGVIKGFLLHQGETNTGDAQWPTYVKKIYEDMLADLELDAESIPILAGEVLSDEDSPETTSCCSSMNTIIHTLPEYIANAYIISSEGCAGQDNAHFNAEGYRELGRRYAEMMLSLMKATEE